MYINLENIIISLGVAIIAGSMPLLLKTYISPTLEQNITKSKEFWLEKKQVYNEALDLIYELALSGPFIDLKTKKNLNPRPIEKKPSVEEINKIYSKLNLVTGNKEIPEKFFCAFSQPEEICKNKEISPGYIAEFIKLLRDDLYDDNFEIDFEKFPIIFNPSN